MSVPIPLRQDFDAPKLRGMAKKRVLEFFKA